MHNGEPMEFFCNIQYLLDKKFNKLDISANFSGGL